MDGIITFTVAVNPHLALGYEFSLLYTVAFTCVLHLLWRAFPRVRRKRWSAPIPCWRLCTIPLARPTVPNFNTLLALHTTNMEESTEILTIFPWYNYLLAVFIFTLR